MQKWWSENEIFRNRFDLFICIFFLSCGGGNGPVVDDTVTFPYDEIVCDYDPEVIGQVTVAVRVSNLLTPVSEKSFQLELHQPVNGLVVSMSKDGQPADMARTLEAVDLHIKVQEGSHMLITVSFGDGSDDLLIETNGTERVFNIIHEFLLVGDLTVEVTAENTDLDTHEVATVTNDITIQAPVPEGGLTMTSDYQDTVASLPPGIIQYQINFDHSHPVPTSPKITINYGDNSCIGSCSSSAIEFVDGTPNIFTHTYSSAGIKTATATIFNEISFVMLQTSVRIQEKLDGLRIDAWEEGNAEVLIEEDEEGRTGVPVDTKFIFEFHYNNGTLLTTVSLFM